MLAMVWLSTPPAARLPLACGQTARLPTGDWQLQVADANPAGNVSLSATPVSSAAPSFLTVTV